MSSAGCRVLVLGYGDIGHAIQHLLGPRQRLEFWDPFRDDLPALCLEEAAGSAEFVFYCLPASAHAELAGRLRARLAPEAVSISVAKGLDEAGRPPGRVFAELLGAEGRYALLYGPMIAEQIRADRYAFAQLGCAEVELFSRVRSLFSDTRLYLQHSVDLAGLSWAAVLKNVYAILFGALDELGLGDNVRGFLAAASLAELDAIATRMGGCPGTPYEMAGLGDLIATSTSAGSHHHELGRRLARGETRHLEGEGVHTLAMIEKHRLFDLDEFRLCRLALEIVREPPRARERFEHCLRTLYG